MQTFFGILMAVMAGFLVWRTVQVVRQNPTLLSRANLSESFRTFGALALILIIVVGFLVLMLRAGHPQ